MNKKERQKLMFISWQIPKHQTVYFFFFIAGKIKAEAKVGEEEAAAALPFPFLLVD